MVQFFLWSEYEKVWTTPVQPNENTFSLRQFFLTEKFIWSIFLFCVCFYTSCIQNTGLHINSATDYHTGCDTMNLNPNSALLKTGFSIIEKNPVLWGFPTEKSSSTESSRLPGQFVLFTAEQLGHLYTRFSLATVTLHYRFSEEWRLSR